MVHQAYTTYEVAKLCGVHHTTVINWVDQGLLLGYTTPGGHRRVQKEDLLTFMRKYHIPLPADRQQRKQRVLIVDDDIEFLEEMRSALEGNGLELECALNGFEAGRKVYKRKPDLILLDFKMPGINGFQVCEILQRDEDTANIPIIAITALRSEDDVLRIKECGVREYLCKPVDIDQLKSVINKTLEIVHPKV